MCRSEQLSQQLKLDRLPVCLENGPALIKRDGSVKHHVRGHVCCLQRDGQHVRSRASRMVLGREKVHIDFNTLKETLIICHPAQSCQTMSSLCRPPQGLHLSASMSVSTWRVLKRPLWALSGLPHVVAGMSSISGRSLHQMLEK